MPHTAGQIDPVHIDHLLPRVSRPSRYVANERHLIRKEWTSDLTKLALCFPEVYEIGMSHTGLKILYHIVNRRGDALAERAYCPWPDMEEQMRTAGIPMFSHESRMPLASFDVVGFSIASELTVTNVLTMLDLAGIPIRASERTDATPIVIGGGATMANPEPMADFFDAFVIGDGEDTIGEVIDAVRSEGTPRDRGRLLRRFSSIEGVYVPSFYDVTYGAGGVVEKITPADSSVPFPVKRRIVPELRLDDFSKSPLVPVTETIQDRLTIEVMRGCTQGCRYCQAGYYYRPVRERTPEDVLTIAANGIASGGWDEVSLMSLSTADHTRIGEMVSRINAAPGARNVGISLPSLRADAFSVELADQVAAVRRSGFTLAPETGSQRLRDVMNKQITDEDVINASRTAFEKGWRLVKLYFMLGLPTETDDDVVSIGRLADHVCATGKSVRRDAQVNASVGCFVPKAFTPFQWVEFVGVSALEHRISILTRNTHARAVKLKWSRPKEASLEAILSRGDRRLGVAILEAWRRGARFDSWQEHFDLGRWTDAISAVGLDADDYLRARSLDESLPWDVIDIGVTKRFLQLEWERALRGETTPDCRVGHCNACGIPGAPDDSVLSSALAAYPVDAEADLLATTDPDPNAAMPGRGFGGGTYRFQYRVGDRFKFVGHADMMRIFHRAFKLAGLSVAISGGSTPRPKVAFGPPLPTGCTSAGEYLDVELVYAADNLRAMTNASLPPGLEVLDAQRIVTKAESLSALVAAARYELSIPDEAIARGDVQERIESFGRAESWPCTRTLKGKERVTELKRAVLQCTASDTANGVSVAVVVRLNDAEGQNANPSLVLGGVFGLDEEAASLVGMARTELYDRNGVPFGALSWRPRRARHMHSKSYQVIRFLDR